MWLVVSLSVVSFLGLLADSVGSSDTVYSRLGISSITLMIFSWIGLFFLRWRQNKFIKGKGFKRAVLLLFFVISLATAFLSIWDYQTSVNYVFSVTKIQQSQLGLASLFLIVVWMLAQTNKWWQDNYRKVLLISPILIVLGLAVVRLWPRNYFLEIVKEDHIIENLQFIILGVGAGVGLKYFRKYCFRYKLLDKVLFFIFLFVLGLTFGDEVAWGQRFFNLQTPEAIAEINRQKELTFHNIYAVEWMVQWLYILIGLFGGLLWIVKKPMVKIWPYFRWIAPSYYLAGFFLLAGGYNLYPFVLNQNVIPEWSEVAELFLYIGLSIHMIEKAKLK